MWGAPAGSDADPLGAWPSPMESASTGRQAVCPFLRLESDAALLDPAGAPSDDHRCVAIEGPRVVSRQQQDLVCLRGAHVDCPRYRRAPAPRATSGHARGSSPSLPRAIAASLVLLALAAGISFGFVLQRGGIDLPPSAQASGAAVAATTSPAPSATAAAAPARGSASPAASAAPTPGITAPASAPPAESPTVERSPTPSPSTRPSASPSPASGGPSASRLAVLKPCRGQAGCYLYTIRVGDNLFSIAHWFGVPLDKVNRWNPTLKTTGIHSGMQIKIPTPTR